MKKHNDCCYLNYNYTNKKELALDLVMNKMCKLKHLVELLPAYHSCFFSVIVMSQRSCPHKVHYPTYLGVFGWISQDETPPFSEN